jgi:hypothetical protein
MFTGRNACAVGAGQKPKAEPDAVFNSWRKRLHDVEDPLAVTV